MIVRLWWHPGLWSLALVRGGLLAFMVTFYLGRIAQQVPLTLDFNQNYAATSLVAMTLIVGLMLWGLSAALAGRRLLNDDMAS